MRSELRTIHLHVGFPKTGTSAIQACLRANQVRLAKCGYYYPRTGLTKLSGHAHLFYAIRRKQLNDPYLDRLFDTLREELSQTRCRDIIISSEYFFSLDRAEIAELLEQFADFKVRMIVYLRRIDERLESGYVQVVRDSEQRFSRNIWDYYDYLQKHPQRVDYRFFCDQWCDLLGRENLTVRAFDRRVIKNSIVEDFLAIFGIALDDSWVAPGNLVNERIPRVVFEALLHFNQVGMDKHQHNELVMELLHHARSNPSTERDNRYCFFTLEQRQQLVAEHAEISHYVTDRFLETKTDYLYRCDDGDYGELYREDAGMKPVFELLKNVIVEKERRRTRWSRFCELFANVRHRFP